MPAISTREFDDDKILKEIEELVRNCAGICNYEICRKVEADYAVRIELKLEMFQCGDSKKIIV